MMSMFMLLALIVLTNGAPTTETTLTERTTPSAQYLVEFENYAYTNGWENNDMRLPERSGASAQKSLHLFKDDIITIPFCLPIEQNVWLKDILFSNDGWVDNLDVLIDEQPLGSFKSADSSNWGYFWNKFHSTGNIGDDMNLPSGTHYLTIKVTEGDEYGVELDAMKLQFSRPDVTVDLKCPFDEADKSMGNNEGGASPGMSFPQKVPSTGQCASPDCMTTTNNSDKPSGSTPASSSNGVSSTMDNEQGPAKSTPPTNSKMPTSQPTTCDTPDCKTTPSNAMTTVKKNTQSESSKPNTDNPGRSFQQCTTPDCEMSSISPSSPSGQSTTDKMKTVAGSVSMSPTKAPCTSADCKTTLSYLLTTLMTPVSGGTTEKQPTSEKPDDRSLQEECKTPDCEQGLMKTTKYPLPTKTNPSDKPMTNEMKNTKSNSETTPSGQTKPSCSSPDCDETKTTNDPKLTTVTPSDCKTAECMNNQENQDNAKSTNSPDNITTMIAATGSLKSPMEASMTISPADKSQPTKPMENTKDPTSCKTQECMNNQENPDSTKATKSPDDITTMIAATGSSKSPMEASMTTAKSDKDKPTEKPSTCKTAECMNNQNNIQSTKSPREDNKTTMIAATGSSKYPMKADMTTSPADKSPNTKPTAMGSSKSPMEAGMTTSPADKSHNSKPTDMGPSKSPMEAGMTTSPADKSHNSKPTDMGPSKSSMEAGMTTSPADKSPNTNPTTMGSSKSPMEAGMTTLPADKSHNSKPTETPSTCDTPECMNNQDNMKSTKSLKKDDTTATATGSSKNPMETGMTTDKSHTKPTDNTNVPNLTTVKPPTCDTPDCMDNQDNAKSTNSPKTDNMTTRISTGSSKSPMDPGMTTSPADKSHNTKPTAAGSSKSPMEADMTTSSLKPDCESGDCKQTTKESSSKSTMSPDQKQCDTPGTPGCENGSSTGSSSKPETTDPECKTPDCKAQQSKITPSSNTGDHKTTNAANSESSVTTNSPDSKSMPTMSDCQSEDCQMGRSSASIPASSAYPSKSPDESKSSMTTPSTATTLPNENGNNGKGNPTDIQKDEEVYQITCPNEKFLTARRNTKYNCANDGKLRFDLYATKASQITFVVPNPFLSSLPSRRRLFKRSTTTKVLWEDGYVVENCDGTDQNIKTGNIGISQPAAGGSLPITIHPKRTPSLNLAFKLTSDGLNLNKALRPVFTLGACCSDPSNVSITAIESDTNKVIPLGQQQFRPDETVKSWVFPTMSSWDDRNIEVNMDFSRIPQPMRVNFMKFEIEELDLNEHDSPEAPPPRTSLCETQNIKVEGIKKDDDSSKKPLKFRYNGSETTTEVSSLIISPSSKSQNAEDEGTRPALVLDQSGSCTFNPTTINVEKSAAFILGSTNPADKPDLDIEEVELEPDVTSDNNTVILHLLGQSFGRSTIQLKITPTETTLTLLQMIPVGRPLSSFFLPCDDKKQTTIAADSSDGALMTDPWRSVSGGQLTVRRR